MTAAHDDARARDREERLARAAAALARAEGVPAARSGGFAGGGGWALSTETTNPSGSSDRDRGSPGARRGSRRRSGRGGEGQGQVPPPEDAATAQPEADPESVARAIVLRQLSMAPRSRAQLARKLRDRGCDDDVAAKVLDRMTEVGLVDDEAYAEMLVRSRQAGKGLARKAIAHELRKQGVEQDVAEGALEQVDAHDERAKAEELVAKKLRTMHGLAPEVQARRLAGMLARKGYSGEVAWPVIRAAIDLAEEHQRD